MTRREALDLAMAVKMRHVRERKDAVLALHDQGWLVWRIVKETGLDRTTVRRYIKEERVPDLTQAVILTWLKDHPDSSARQVAAGIDTRDTKYVYLLLQIGESAGKCQRFR